MNQFMANRNDKRRRFGAVSFDKTSRGEQHRFITSNIIRCKKYNVKKMQNKNNNECDNCHFLLSTSHDSWAVVSTESGLKKGAAVKAARLVGDTPDAADGRENGA